MPGAFERGYIRSVQVDPRHVPSFDVYPFSIPAITKLGVLKMHPKVTYLTGENGSGKSTLLEAMAVAWGFNAEGGTLHMRFETRKSHSDLHRHLKFVRNGLRPGDGYFLRAESYFNVATEIERLDQMEDFGSSPSPLPAYGGRSLHEMSHGEAFLALLSNRLRSNGLYLFDEPEAALSPSRQMAALGLIHQLVLSGSQFIIATHSPIMLAYPEATIYALDEDGIRETAYDDTEQVAVMRNFLNRRERMTKLILEDDDGARE